LLKDELKRIGEKMMDKVDLALELLPAPETVAPNEVSSLLPIALCILLKGDLDYYSSSKMGSKRKRLCWSGKGGRRVRTFNFWNPQGPSIFFLIGFFLFLIV
jgi:hypothetical protein